MGLRAVEVRGADDYGVNVNGTDYAATAQLTTARTYVYNMTVFVRSAVAADRFVYLFDTAEGDSSSVTPKVVLSCPYGLTATLDIPGGSVFKSGVYVVVATDEVADAITPPTAGSANDAMVSLEYRLA